MYAIAVASNGANLYVTTANYGTVKYALSAGSYVKGSSPFDPAGHSSGIAVAPSGDVLIDRGNPENPGGRTGVREVGVFEPSGVMLASAGAQVLTEGAVGVGMNGESGDIYVADSEGAREAYIYEPGVMPAMPTAESYSLDGGSVVFNGTLSGGETSYYFAYNKGVSCEGGGEQTTPVASASSAQNVHTEVTELTRFTRYSFCIVVTNKYGSVTSSPVSFEVGQVQPKVTSVSAAIGIHTATVHAEVNPETIPTAYYVEYGTSIPYESRTAELGAGSGETPISVSSTLTGLQPNTLYHFRVVAVNSVGRQTSQDMTLTTYSPGSPGLPDGRVYELVSQFGNPYSEAYLPGGEQYVQGQPGLDGSIVGSESPSEASLDGDAVTYAGSPDSTGGDGSNEGKSNQYVARRFPQGGWTQENVTPLGDLLGLYEGFTNDLTMGFIGAETELPFVAQETLPVGTFISGGPPLYTALFERVFGEADFRPFFTGTPSRPAGDESTPETFHITYAGSSADDSHQLVESDEDLLKGDGPLEKELSSDVQMEGKDAQEIHQLEEEAEKLRVEFERLKQEGKTSEEEVKKAEFKAKIAERTAKMTSDDPVDHNSELYVVSGGKAELVNVLPTGTVDQDAKFPTNLANVVSADGSRVFWASSSGALYMREDGSRTVPVSNGLAKFWTASTDGKYAFYTQGGRLWRFDVENETKIELAGASQGVLGVIGTNETGEDGAYVYFVSEEKLTSEENMAKQQAVEEADNLYVYEPDAEHPGQAKIAFIGTLSEEDHRDWNAGLGSRLANTTPDGEGLVFSTNNNLAGHPYPGEGSSEVYVYDTQDASLFCASCRAQASGGHLIVSLDKTHTFRWISENGDRVFFDSGAPLVAQDVNGKQDVYEWERDGSDACTEVDGCVYLLSNGVEGNASLLDASSDGDDVFIVTRQQLVPELGNEGVELYDARVDGVLPVIPPQCTGTGCQGAPASPPVFATPASVTFAGLGNFPSPTTTRTASTKTKSLARSQKLSKALTVCRQKRDRKKRTVCEAHARKLYGAKATAKKSAKRETK